MNKKIKIAIIGCGRISAKHFEAIKKHNDSLELVAVCDKNYESGFTEFYNKKLLTVNP